MECFVLGGMLRVISILKFILIYDSLYFKYCDSLLRSGDSPQLNKIHFLSKQPMDFQFDFTLKNLYTSLKFYEGALSLSTICFI